MQASCYIQNARIVSPGMDCSNMLIEIQNGCIQNLHNEDHSPPPSSKIFDAQGMILVPGFIDIHTHGANGHDFCDGKEDSLASIAEAKLREGVTTFLPTTLTLPHSTLRNAFEKARPYFDSPRFAKVPGIHLEGPFINPKWAGAQNPDFVRSPDWDEIEQLNSILPIQIVSMAIEMKGGVSLAKTLMDHSILPSLAHTGANARDFATAKKMGVRHLTHFCNQMTPLHHREFGLVGAGLLDDAVLLEMICDGIHLVPEMIQLLFKVVGPQRIMLITDSIAASGLANNQRTHLGELEIIVQDGVARLPSGTLAGSTLKMNRALANAHRFTSLTLSNLIQTTSLNQAHSLGLPQLGKIEIGYFADLVLLNEDFEVRAVFVNGVERLNKIEFSITN